MDLIVRQSDTGNLTQENYQEIDNWIDNKIQEFKGKSIDLIKFTTEAVALCTATEARSKALADQGITERFCGWFTGKNDKLRAANTNNLATAQYIAQKSIARLAEQNALTMELAVTIGNRVNYLSQESMDMRNEVRAVWETLDKVASMTKSKIANLSNRIYKLEKNSNLLFWKETIEDKTFNDIAYQDMSDVKKIICLVSDFYVVTDGNWNEYKDLVFLRSVMREIGIDTKGTITPCDFYREILTCPPLYSKQIDDTSLNDRSLESPVHAPLISGLHKLNTLNNEESYLVETVTRQMEKASLQVDKTDILMDMIGTFLKQETNLDVHSGIKAFEFAVELLSGMKVLNTGVVTGNLLNCQLADKDNEIAELADTIKEKEAVINSIKQDIEKRKITERTLVPVFPPYVQDSDIEKNNALKFVNLVPHRTQVTFGQQIGFLVLEFGFMDFAGTSAKQPIYALNDGTLFWLNVLADEEIKKEKCICAVISKKFDSTDNIVEWINKSSISIPSKFYDIRPYRKKYGNIRSHFKGYEGLYNHRIHKNESYQKELRELMTLV